MKRPLRPLPVAPFVDFTPEGRDQLARILREAIRRAKAAQSPPVPVPPETKP